MAFTINGLSQITQLSPTDSIAILTPEGLKLVSAELLGDVISDTSLYESYNRVSIDEINLQNVSTTDKVRKYLASDTSSEVYLEYKNGSINILQGTIITDVNTTKPVVVQAKDIHGNLLYWNEDPDNSEFDNGLPWKTKDKQRKVFITKEVTDYPVKTYQYSIEYLRKSEVEFDSDGNPKIVDKYISNNENSIGAVEKTKDSFIVKLSENGKTDCGLEMSLNQDGTVSGKLLGTWEDLNDWDITDALIKKEFKDWFYHEQDYNTYVKILSVDTSDKIGWYLTKDTTNHVYTVTESNSIKVYLAQNKTSGSGDYSKEQAKNLLGELLYWTQDMTTNVGVTSNHIPVKNGIYTFMTTEKTSYPVYIYQYTLTEMFSIETDTLEDGGRGAKIIFSGLNGKKGEIYKTTSQFIMRYLNASGKEYSKLVMGETASEFSGNWNDILPPQDSTTKGKVLVSNGTAASWKSIDEITT